MDTSLRIYQPSEPDESRCLVGRYHEIAVGIVRADIRMVVCEPFGQVQRVRFRIRSHRLSNGIIAVEYGLCVLHVFAW